MSFFTAHIFFEGIACWALVVLVGVNGARVQGADTLPAAFRKSGSTDAVRDGLERKSFWRVGYSASRGAAVVTKERMLPLVEEVPWSVGVHVSRDALPTSRWARDLGFPSLSFSYRFIRLGSDRALGYAHCVYSSYRFYFLRRSWLEVSSNVGVGLGFLPKHYRRGTVGYNSGVGSLVNVYLEAQVTLSWSLAGGVTFGVAGEYIHLSNGSFRMPNSGLNYLFGTLLLSQALLPVKRGEARWPAPAPLRHSLCVDVAGSAVERGVPNGLRYPLCAVSVSYFYAVARRVAVGALADVYWDFSLSHEVRQGRLPEQSVWRMPTVSVFAGCRMHLGRLMPEVMLGYNAYQVQKDFPFALRLGLRYRIAPWCEPFVAVVTKKVRANHIAFGVGVDLFESFRGKEHRDAQH